LQQYPDDNSEFDFLSGHFPEAAILYGAVPVRQRNGIELPNWTKRRSGILSLLCYLLTDTEALLTSTRAE
jgi:hypothetical protein